MPAYIIFNDRTLIDMCVKLPTDKKSMLQVSGVGEAKFDKYGERFLSIISDYKDKNRTLVQVLSVQTTVRKSQL